MNNKSKYASAFSGVRHSEELTERIIRMEKSKTKLNFKKCLVCVAVVVTLLICAALTVNAVTDGAVSEYLPKSVRVFFNGKEVDAVKAVKTTDGDVNIDIGDAEFTVDGVIADNVDSYEVELATDEFHSGDVITYSIGSGTSDSSEGDFSITYKTVEETTEK